MHRYWRHHPWHSRAAALGLSALFCWALQWLAPQAVSGAESIAGDFTWRLGASSAPERRLVIVDIDEASLAEVGPWPWPRSTVAKLSQRLESAGAAVQVFDLVFDAPKDGDSELAQAWAGASSVAGQIFSLDPATTPAIGQIGGALAAAGCPSFAPASTGFIGNHPGLLAPRQAVGHMTPRVEFDGVVRKVPAVVCHQGKAYPSLALAALWRAAQPDGKAAASAADWAWSAPEDRAASPLPLAPHAWLTSPSLPGVLVPVDDRGDVRVPFRIDRKAFASVSAHQVLNGSADLSLLRGTVALVGATAFRIGDVTATPLSAVASGVEVHAQSIAGLLDHRVPYTPWRAAQLQVLAVALVAAVLLGVAVRRRGAPVKRLPVAGVLLALACYGGASLALVQADLWLPWFLPALFALVASTALATVEHALTRAQRERLSAHLGSYLPAPVAERLKAMDPSGALQVDTRQVSVLVADIRNFSAFAAHRPPEQTAALLHAVYCTAVDVVEQHGGVVENVVGDSVMAIWNAYAERPDHPQRALAAAKELLRSTRALLAHPVAFPPAPQDDHAVQALALGVGVETGKAIVGSFGPARRRAHVALGEPVSVASRLQEMTQDLSMPILIGPQLAALLPADSTESLGDYLLVGMSRQYTLFAPSDWAELVPSDQLWAGVSRPGGEELVDHWAVRRAPGTSLPQTLPPLRGA